MGHDAEHDTQAVRIDDCWNRSGSRGDRTCARLAEHLRCENCPVFEQAAATLLECAASEVDAYASPNVSANVGDERARKLASPGPAATHAALVFRVAEEWLALPAASLSHVEAPRPVHPLPHRQNSVVLGLVNVRGTLTVAASLAGMLELDRPSPALPASSKRGCERMLVARHGSESAALPVDEVEGLFRYGASELMPVPATVALAATSHARGVFAWRNTTVGLLDTDRMFASLRQNLR